MTKKIETGAAPVSKYAAKRTARVNNENANAPKEVAEIAVKMEDQSVEHDAPEVVATGKPKKPFTRTLKTVKGEVNVNDMFPQHFVNIALIIKNNAEIRRFTAIGILNYLLQKGIVKGEKRFVSFKWNKFTVKCDGLIKEYSYTEPFFLNALVASFSSFSASAQRTINEFCNKEFNCNIDKAVDTKEVDNITTLNEEYQATSVNIAD
jgi:hypothetical protein